MRRSLTLIVVVMLIGCGLSKFREVEGPKDYEYPKQAREEGIEGTIRLKGNVDRTGRVLAVENLTPSGPPLLTQAAEEHFRKLKHLEGDRYTMTYTFVLKGPGSHPTTTIKIRALTKDSGEVIIISQRPPA